MHTFGKIDKIQQSPGYFKAWGVPIVHGKIPAGVCEQCPARIGSDCCKLALMQGLSEVLQVSCTGAGQTGLELVKHAHENLGLAGFTNDFLYAGNAFVIMLSEVFHRSVVSLITRVIPGDLSDPQIPHPAVIATNQLHSLDKNALPVQVIMPCGIKIMPNNLP
jgi:hypothetical protein